MTRNLLHVAGLAVLLAALFILILAHDAPAAVTADPYHAISMTELAWVSCVAVDPGDDDVFGWNAGKLLKLTGDTWGVVKDLSGTYGAVSARDLYVSPTGDIYVSPNTSGVLVRMAQADYANTEVLTFACTGVNTFWHMAEAADSLYVTEYGECEAGGGPSVYRSTNGNTWANMETFSGFRHLHGVWATAAEGSLYVALGDDAGSQSIQRSVNAGVDWTEISSTKQPVSFAYAPDGDRLWGSDTELTDNTIYTTSDDSAFTTELTLTGDDDAFVWAMTRLSTGIVFAGTQGISGGSDCHILRRDLAGDWYSVFELGACSYWEGVEGFSTATSGDVFYAVDSKNDCVWRIEDHKLYTVGTGGEYATIADAVTGTATGDTLVLLEQGHVGVGIAADAGTTWRGISSAEAATTYLKNNGNNAIVNVTAGLLTLRNLTVRTPGSFGGFNTQLFEVNTSGGLDCYNVRFANCRHAGDSVLIDGNAASGGIRLVGCTIDSCTTGATGAAILELVSTKFTMRDCVVTNNFSYRTPIYIYHSAAVDTAQVLDSLFAHNRARADYASALYIHTNAASGNPIVDHCTFDDNEAVAGSGQVRFGTNATTTIQHTIISGADSTEAFNATYWPDNIHYCDMYGNADDTPPANSDTVDVIHVDPEYTTTDLAATYPYMTMSIYPKSGTSSPRKTADGSYMGWLDPPAIPTGADLMGRLYRRRH